jgi:transcriptional regulator with XRE-family HTH domain
MASEFAHGHDGMTTPNESGQPDQRLRLAAARRRRGWGQVRAAIEINGLGLRLGYSEDELRVDAHALSRWERGVHEPKARYIRIMCSLYELPADQLDLAPPVADGDPPLPTSADANTPALALSAAAQLEEHMRRRTFARFLVLAGGAAVFRPDVLATVFDGINGIDDALADRLYERSLQYMRQWDQLPPHVLLTVVMGHLEELRMALDCSRSSPITQRLHVIASEAAAFAGMLGWFTQDRSVAEIGLSRADEHADAVGHAPAKAVVLAIRADFHSHVQLGNHIGSAITRTMLEAAEATIGATPSPARAWILLRQAEEYAVIGQETESNRCLDLADATFAAVESVPEGMFSHWSSDMHRAFRGNCAQLIGNYGESLDILSPVLNRIDPDAVSNRISLQTDMAAVLARQGEPEQASILLANALSAANRAGLRERVKRIAGVRSGPLDGYRKHPAVRRLDDQLQSLSAPIQLTRQ